MPIGNPRTAPRFDEIRENGCTTYKRKTSSTGAIDFLPTAANPYPATSSTQEGQSVAMSSNDTVKVGAAGDPLIGKLFKSEADGLCSVQTNGILKFTVVNDANVPVLGRGVVCDGAGGVRIAAASSEYKERGAVIELDTTNLFCYVDLDR